MYLYCLPLLLILIFMYGICKIIQTYRDKVIMSRGIANQRARATRAWEEEEQACINCRKVDLPPPQMDFYVTWHYRQGLMVFRSIEQDLSLASSFSLHHLIQETKMRTVACSSSINFSWFLLILGWRVGVHWRCKLKLLLGWLCPLMAWRRVLLLCLLVIR